jgi:hypothetical protein
MSRTRETVIYLVESGLVCMVSPRVMAAAEELAMATPAVVRLGPGLLLVTGFNFRIWKVIHCFELYGIVYCILHSIVYCTETLLARILAGVTVTPGGTAVRAFSCVGLKVPVFWMRTWGDEDDNARVPEDDDAADLALLLGRGDEQPPGAHGGARARSQADQRATHDLGTRVHEQSTVSDI